MLCPLCKTKTNPLDEQGIMAAQCPQCQGIWISKMALDRLTRREATTAGGVLTANDAPLQETAARVAQSNTTSELECPFCVVSMEKARFHPQIPVQMDQCPKCDYIWLDAGEQDLLLRLYRELMSGDDPAVVEKRDKLAQLDAMRGSVPADIATFDDTNTFNNDSRAASIADSALNTGINVVGDLSRRDGGVSVAIDVAEFVISLLWH